MCLSLIGEAPGEIELADAGGQIGSRFEGGVHFEVEMPKLLCCSRRKNHQTRFMNPNRRKKSKELTEQGKTKKKNRISHGGRQNCLHRDLALEEGGEEKGRAVSGVGSAGGPRESFFRSGPVREIKSPRNLC